MIRQQVVLHVQLSVKQSQVPMKKSFNVGETINIVYEESNQKCNCTNRMPGLNPNLKNMNE